MGVPGLRQPPANTEAEAGLLGAILISNREYDRVADFLRPYHFAVAVNARIYELMERLLGTGVHVSPVTLQSYAECDQLIIDAGGMKYVAGIAASAVTLCNTAEYGRLIVDLWRRREVISVCMEQLEAAFDVSTEVSAVDVIEAAEGSLAAIAAGEKIEGPIAIGKLASDIIMRWDEQNKSLVDKRPIGLQTGFYDLDRVIGGMMPGDMIIVAGRPSMGKSALAMAIADNAATYFSRTDVDEDRGKSALIFSLEMSSRQITERVLVAKSGVQSPRLRRKPFEPADYDRILEASHKIAESRVIVDDTAAITLSAIRSRARRMMRRYKLGLVVIDYLQIMGLERGLNYERMLDRITYWTAGLKALAKELKIPVIVLSQLSREVERRDDKRPQLSDLRDSGTIEQDADVVAFVYREEYYIERAGIPAQRANESDETYATRYAQWEAHRDAVQGIAEVIVAKNRNGPIGSAKLRWDGARTWFENLAEQR